MESRSCRRRGGPPGGGGVVLTPAGVPDHVMGLLLGLQQSGLPKQILRETKSSG